MSQEAKSELTTAQKSRIERNRAKALLLLQSKLVSHHPYGAKKDSVIKVKGTKYIDSGGGFLVEQEVAKPAGSSTVQNANATTETTTDAIEIPVSFEECLECGDSFADSYLFENFSYSVCDKCRDSERHALITRTEAKAEYLLKDCDIDKREPPLKFIRRKNPHNNRWNEMKLYLHPQIEQRAMEVWGSEEELMRQHELREEKRDVSKFRKYNKQMKQLRMEVRSSLYTKETKANHIHEFGPDTYNEEEDNYSHSCLTCPYTETYEKM